MHTKMDDQEYVRAGLNTQERDENIFKSQDPFNKSWENLKDYSGLNQNFRRKTARNVTKAINTATNAYIKKINNIKVIKSNLFKSDGIGFLTP